MANTPTYKDWDKLARGKRPQFLKVQEMHPYYTGGMCFFFNVNVNYCYMYIGVGTRVGGGGSGGPGPSKYFSRRCY